jgi:sugar/nucleoside kinase (ribokinase family)
MPDRLLARASFVHASGISMAISASASDAVLAAFVQARALISAAAAFADFFFPSLEDAEALSGKKGAEANLAWAHRRDPAQVGRRHRGGRLFLRCDARPAGRGRLGLGRGALCERCRRA